MFLDPPLLIAVYGEAEAGDKIVPSLTSSLFKRKGRVFFVCYSALRSLELGAIGSAWLHFYHTTVDAA